MRTKVTDNLLITILQRYYTNPGCLRSLNSGASSSFAQKRSLHLGTARSFSQSLLSRSSTDISINNAVRSRKDTSLRPRAATSLNAPASNEIAVIGGGITGLSTAFYLTKEIPDAKVTIYEGSDTLGGWLRSKTVDVADGTIIFEQGPRTLRPSTVAGILTLDMASIVSLLVLLVANTYN